MFVKPIGKGWNTHWVVSNSVTVYAASKNTTVGHCVSEFWVMQASVFLCEEERRGRKNTKEFL